MSVREFVRDFVRRGAEYVLLIAVVTPFLTLLVALVSDQPLMALFSKMGMLVGMLVALSGAFSFLGLSNIFLEHQGGLRLTEAERHDVSFHAMVRIVCGIAAFILFLLLS